MSADVGNVHLGLNINGSLARLHLAYTIETRLYAQEIDVVICIPEMLDSVGMGADANPWREGFPHRTKLSGPRLRFAPTRA